MTQFTIGTFGPCCRCSHMARRLSIVGGRRYVVHNNPTMAPCPVQPGEMPEVGEPVEVKP